MGRGAGEKIAEGLLYGQPPGSRRRGTRSFGRSQARAWAAEQPRSYARILLEEARPELEREMELIEPGEDEEVTVDLGLDPSGQGIRHTMSLWDKDGFGICSESCLITCEELLSERFFGRVAPQIAALLEAGDLTLFGEEKPRGPERS